MKKPLSSQLLQPPKLNRLTLLPPVMLSQLTLLQPLTLNQLKLLLLPASKPNNFKHLLIIRTC